MYPKACWILCTPRVGSSFLCELLNNLGSFPVYHHKQMKLFRGPLEVGQTFNEWSRLFDNLSQFLENPPPYSKMIFHQYIETMSGLNKKKRYDVGWYPEKHDKQYLIENLIKYNSKFVASIFPDMRYILLARETVSHAVSLYFARTTKKYHIYDEASLNAYMSMNVQDNDSRLIEAYKDALDYRNSWNKFLNGSESLLNVDYGELVNDTESTLNRIMNFLQISGDVKAAIQKTLGDGKRIHRMTRPDAIKFEARLKQLTSIRML